MSRLLLSGGGDYLGVLALDLAGVVGWAKITSPWDDLTSGAWDNSKGPLGARLLRLFSWLEVAVDQRWLVVWERPMPRGQRSSSVLVGYATVATLVCERVGASYADVPIGTLKKHATGSGSAKKPQMIAAANARWGLSLGPEDEDEADALCVLAWAEDHVGL